MADFAGGRTRDIDALFQRLYASLQSQPNVHRLRRTLLSMRSDQARCTDHLPLSYYSPPS